MKVEWFKFSEKKAPRNQNIWVTDGVSVRATNDVEVDFFPEFLSHWAIRENPLPPEKELHRCTDPDMTRISCYESDEKLWLKESGNFDIDIKFCPFCGFTLQIVK